MSPNQDFLIPDDPTSGTPPTDFLVPVLPRDEDDNRPRAYTIQSILEQATDLSESQLSSAVRAMLAQGVIIWSAGADVDAERIVYHDSVLYFVTASDNGDGDEPSDNSSFTVISSPDVGTDLTVQYAETNSDTDGDWHTAQVDNDGWIRLGIGDPAVYTEGIPLTRGITNLSIADRGEETLKITSDTGGDATIPASTNSLAGAATAAQVTKLEGVEAEATKNASGDGITIGDAGEINIDNPFTEDDETKLDAIEAESTKNIAGDSTTIGEDGEINVEIDDDTIGRNVDNELQLKAEGVDEGHVSGSLTDDEKGSFRTKIGAGSGDLLATQRSESIELGAAASVTHGNISAAIAVAATDPVSVEYPLSETTPELVSATGDTITIVLPGLYLVEWEDIVVNITITRANPTLSIYLSSDAIGTDTPMKSMSTAYLREVDNEHLVYAGSTVLRVHDSDTDIKVAITDSGSYTPTAFSLDAGSKLVFSQVGIKGDRGDINTDNNFTEDDETKLDAIEEEATKNVAGTGTTIGADGEINIDNEFTEDDESKLDDALTEVEHDESLSGLGTTDDPLRLVSMSDVFTGVESDETLTGLGTEPSPLVVANPFTEDDETKLDAIEEEATKNAAGDGLDESDEGTLSVDNSYIDDRIDAADQWFDHFRTPYTPSFATDTGHRWQSLPQSDGSGHYIRIQPGDAHQSVLRVLVEDSKIQVRNENGTVRNTFTLEQDPADPDVNGVWELYGDWEHTPSFDEGHNYTMYYSARRESSIFTDDDTIEGTGLHDDPIKVKDGGITDEKVSDSLTLTRKRLFRNKIDVPPGIYVLPANVGRVGDTYTVTAIGVDLVVGLEISFESTADNTGAATLRLNAGTVRSLVRADGEDFEAGELSDGDLVRASWNGTHYRSQITVSGSEASGDASDIDTTTSEFGKHVPTDADNVQKSLKALNDNDYFIRYTVERNYVTDTFGILNSDTHLGVTSGTLYDFCLSEYTGAEALPANYVSRIGRHTRIKLVSGDTVWRGEILEHRFDDLSIGGSSSDDFNILTVDFAEERTGTFAQDDTVEVSIGYAAIGRFIASDIPFDLANIDGMLADVLTGDLQTVIDFIDDLTATHMFVESDEFEGLLKTNPLPSVVQQTFEVVDQLGDHDEDNHFFGVTPADLTEDKIGYAAEAHTGLNTAGGTQASHSLIKGLFHEYDADKGYRWHLLYDDDAMGIGGTDDAYGGPSLHALDGSGATNRILNIFFKVGDRDNNRLFNPYAGGIDLDPNSRVGLSETLTVFEIIWNRSSRRFEFHRHLFDTGSMSGYWESATDPLNESKDIWVLTQDDGLVKIDADWFDDAGSTYARWIVPDTETAVLAALNGIEDDQHCLVTVADEDSVGTTPDYVRTYDHGFYLQLKIGSDPIETKWLKPASYNPGVWNWVSDWEQLDSAPTTVGANYEAAVYDVEGAGQYTADDEVTLHEDLARKDQLGLTFVSFRHDRMDDQYKEYQASQIYPMDADIVLSRRNLYQDRKFVFGRVEGSSNKGLPIPEIDFRTGARGNVDYNRGEVIGSDLMDLTVIRPSKGMWRIEVDINVLTYQHLDNLSISLLRVDTDQQFYLGNDFVRIGSSGNFGIGETDAEDIAIDSDGNAFIIGMISDRLSTLNLSTGVATPVTTTTGFNVGENNAVGLAITEDGTVFMTGRLRDMLYTLNRTTGAGTQVGTLLGGFGVSEMFPSSLAHRGNELFMSGQSNDATYQLNTSTGAATRIGNIENYGLGLTTGVVKLFVVNDRIFFYEAESDRFYELDERTGEGIPIGSDDVEIDFEGLAEHDNVIYAIIKNQLHYSNVLDLPIAISEGIGLPIISRYSFPGAYSGGNDYSITGKLISTPFYTDGTEDFSLVWNLIRRIGETEAKYENYNWSARDFKVHMERLAV